MKIIVVKKVFVLLSFILTITLFIAGVTIFDSYNIGYNLSFSAPGLQDAVESTDDVNNVIKFETESCMIAGAIMSLVGGGGAVISGIGIYKEIESIGHKG